MGILVFHLVNHCQPLWVNLEPDNQGKEVGEKERVHLLCEPRFLLLQTLENNMHLVGLRALVTLLGTEPSTQTPLSHFHSC